MKNIKIFLALIFFWLSWSSIYALDNQVVENKMWEYYTKMDNHYDDNSSKISKLQSIIEKIEVLKKEKSSNPQAVWILDFVIENIHSQMIDYEKDSAKIIWESITHDNFWHNQKYFTKGNYNFADIEFSLPVHWERFVAMDTWTKSWHDFYNPQKTKRLFITHYFINKCPELFTYCSPEEYVERTWKEDLDLLISFLNKREWLELPHEYTLDNLWEKAMVSKDRERYYFEIDGNVLSFQFSFEDWIHDTDFIDQVLSSIQKIDSE